MWQPRTALRGAHVQSRTRRLRNPTADAWLDNCRQRPSRQNPRVSDVPPFKRLHRPRSGEPTRVSVGSPARASICACRPHNAMSSPGSLRLLPIHPLTPKRPHPRLLSHPHRAPPQTAYGLERRSADGGPVRVAKWVAVDPTEFGSFPGRPQQRRRAPLPPVHVVLPAYMPPMPSAPRSCSTLPITHGLLHNASIHGVPVDQEIRTVGERKTPEDTELFYVVMKVLH